MVNLYAAWQRRFLCDSVDWVDCADSGPNGHSQHSPKRYTTVALWPETSACRQTQLLCNHRSPVGRKKQTLSFLAKIHHATLAIDFFDSNSSCPIDLCGVVESTVSQRDHHQLGEFPKTNSKPKNALKEAKPRLHKRRGRRVQQHQSASYSLSPKFLELLYDQLHCTCCCDASIPL